MEPRRRRAGTQAAQLEIPTRKLSGRILVLLPAVVIVVVAGVLAFDDGPSGPPVGAGGTRISQDLWWLVMEEMDWSASPMALLGSEEADPALQSALDRHGLDRDSFARTSRMLLDQAQMQAAVVNHAEGIRNALADFDLPDGVEGPAAPETVAGMTPAEGSWEMRDLLYRNLNATESREDG